MSCLFLSIIIELSIARCILIIAINNLYFVSEYAESLGLCSCLILISGSLFLTWLVLFNFLLDLSIDHSLLLEQPLKLLGLLLDAALEQGLVP